MSNKQSLEQIKERIKEYLPQYLASHGVQVNNGSTFRCINPEHSDSNPSCGIVPNTDNKLFHCFGCGAVGDIFTAASFLEDKAPSGRAFVLDNMTHLAKRFGVDMPDYTCTPEEQYDMETYQAYSHAAQIIKHSQLSPAIQAKLLEYGWTRDTQMKLGIGSVSNFDDYLHKMTKHHGHKLEFLREVDLARKSLFDENNLIYIVKDEHGAPVGFAARSLKFEEDSDAYEAQRAKIIAAEGEDSPKLEELFKPAKYLNSASSETKTKNRIYQKSRRLFNFDLARKFQPLFVVEGYGDCATMYNVGIKGAAAIGSTSFTREHLDLVLSSGIKHIVFVLDADKGGIDATERFVKLLEECLGGHVGLRAEIVVMPEGSDDPDTFIRKHQTPVQGAAAFRALERLDIFSWQLKKAIGEGEDPVELSNRMIPLIVNEPNNLYRLSLAKRLATYVSLPEQVIWREVMRKLDAEETKLNEEKTLIANRTASELRRDPSNIDHVLETAKVQVEMVEKRRRGYDPQNIVRSMEYTRDRAEKQDSAIELTTGYRCLDKALGGLPREQKFIGLPGKPNQGKSTFLDNLTWNLIENNSDVMVLYHTVDDSLFDRKSRLLASKYSAPSEYFSKAGFFLRQVPEFEETYNKAMAWLDQVTEEERLVLTDVELLPPTLPALEGWVKTLRQRFPNRALIVMGDHFHLYDLPGMEEGEGKVRAKSVYCKRLVNANHCTGLFTMELPKESLAPRKRPRLRNIKGSSGMAYDLSCNMGVYNEVKDIGEEATIFWTDPKDIERVIGPNGEESFVPKRKPILELVIDKSKISSFDGTLYFRLDLASGHLEECSESEQIQMRRKGTESRARGAEAELASSTASFRSF